MQHTAFIRLLGILCLVTVNAIGPDEACWGLCMDGWRCVSWTRACQDAPFEKEERCMSKVDICNQRVDLGRRCAYAHDIPESERWSYNKNTGQCLAFQYRGCDGNGNNFKTEQDCQSVCGNYMCHENLDFGLTFCRVGETNWAGQRFAYSQLAKQCLGFHYFGCFGNSNRFETKAACEAKCMGKT